MAEETVDERDILHLFPVIARLPSILSIPASDSCIMERVTGGVANRAISTSIDAWMIVVRRGLRYRDLASPGRKLIGGIAESAARSSPDITCARDEPYRHEGCFRHLIGGTDVSNIHLRFQKAGVAPTGLVRRATLTSKVQLHEEAGGPVSAFFVRRCRDTMFVSSVVVRSILLRWSLGIHSPNNLQLPSVGRALTGLHRVPCPFNSVDQRYPLLSFVHAVTASPTIL